MDNYEFVNTAYRIATTINTKYKLGGWGEQEDGYYLFDCVCLIKSILWGFNFSKGGHGGAIYLANGVPDVGANKMITLCQDISYDFTNIDIGEILWLDGHVGIYIGDRNVVEATSAWQSKVLISEVLDNGVRIRDNHQVYRWLKHGKLPYLEYTSGYATIKYFEVNEITSREAYLSYDTDLPISKALYTLDGEVYKDIPSDNIIRNLNPDTVYKIGIKVERKYTNNYTESKIIEFKTLDEHIKLKYKIGDEVLVNGPIKLLDGEVKELKDYIGYITNINDHYGTKDNYEIDNIGWVSEDSISLYENTSIFELMLFFIVMSITFFLVILL